jgi:hypothetical protein
VLCFALLEGSRKMLREECTSEQFLAFVWKDWQLSLPRVPDSETFKKTTAQPFLMLTAWQFSYLINSFSMGPCYVHCFIKFWKTKSSKTCNSGSGCFFYQTLSH